MTSLKEFYENYNKRKGITETDSFRNWFSGVSTAYDLNPDPNAGFYDYESAYRDGVRKPDKEGHWPSKYKKVGHPNMIVDGINTKTGARATDVDYFFESYHKRKIESQAQFDAKLETARDHFRGVPQKPAKIETTGAPEGGLDLRLPTEGVAKTTPSGEELPQLIDKPGFYKGERINDILNEFGPTQKKADVLRLLREGKLQKGEELRQATEDMPPMPEADRIRMIGEAQTDYLYEEHVKDLNNFYTKWQNIKDNPSQLVPFLSGAVEAKHIIDLSQAVGRFEEGTETLEDIDLLQSYLEQGDKDSTFAYKVFDVLAQLPAFAGELYATGGVYTAVKKGTIEATEKLAKKWLTGVGKKQLEKKIADRLAVKILGGLVGATAQAPLAGVTRITASTIENMIPNFEYYQDEQDQLKLFFTDEGDSIGLALTKAFGEQWVEVASEKSGGVLKEIKIFNTIAQKTKDQLFKIAFIKKFAKVNPNSSLADLNKLLKKAGWDGVIAEMGEERVADVGHGILAEAGLGDQEFKLPSLEDLAVELVAFSIPGSAIGLTKKALGQKTIPAEPAVKPEDVLPEEPTRGDAAGVDRGQVPPDEPPPPPAPGQQKIQKPEEPKLKPIEKKPITNQTFDEGLAGATDMQEYIIDTARQSPTLADFKKAIAGELADGLSNNTYIEPVELTYDDVERLSDEIQEGVPETEIINTKESTYTNTVYKGIYADDTPVIVDENGKLISGHGQIVRAADEGRLPEPLRGIKLTSGDKVRVPGKNMLKIDELWKNSQKQMSIFQPKAPREQKPKVYRGQPPVTPTKPKVAKPRPIPKKKKKPEDRLEGIEFPRGMNQAAKYKSILSEAGFSDQEIAIILARTKSKEIVGVRSYNADDIIETIRAGNLEKPELLAPKTKPERQAEGQKQEFRHEGLKFKTKNVIVGSGPNSMKKAIYYWNGKEWDLMEMKQGWGDFSKRDLDRIASNAERKKTEAKKELAKKKEAPAEKRPTQYELKKILHEPPSKKAIEKLKELQALYEKLPESMQNPYSGVGLINIKQRIKEIEDIKVRDELQEKRMDLEVAIFKALRAGEKFPGQSAFEEMAKEHNKKVIGWHKKFIGKDGILDDEKYIKFLEAELERVKTQKKVDANTKIEIDDGMEVYTTTVLEAKARLKELNRRKEPEYDEDGSWAEVVAEIKGIEKALKDIGALSEKKVEPKKAPAERKRIRHYTKEENVEKILKEGFDSSLTPVHGVGGLEAGKKTKKLGKDVLYFTTDDSRWSSAVVFVGEGKGDISKKAYDYDNQKWVDEKNAYKKIDLKLIEADIKEDAKILNINSYAAAKNFLKDNDKSVDMYEFMEDVLATAQKAGYDVVHIDGRIDKAWEMPDGKTTKFGDKSWYKLLTGNSGKSDYFILNKDAIEILKPKAAAKKEEPKKEPVKKAGPVVALEGKEIRDKFNNKGSGHMRMLGQLARLVDQGSLAKEEMDLLLNIFLNTKDSVLVPLKIDPSTRMTRAGGNFKATVVRGLTRQETLENKRNLKLKDPRIAVRTGIVDRIKSGEWKLGDTGMKIFLHEFGHYGYFFLLTNEERALVDRVFRSMTKTQRMKHFERGFHKGNQFGQKYGSTNVEEFFAETFAFYVKANKSPHSVLEKVYSHLKKELKQALKYLSGKQNNNTEKLAWVYEKILTGDKTITEADVKEMFAEPEVEPPEKKGTPTKEYYSPSGGVSQEAFDKELDRSGEAKKKSETIAQRRKQQMITIAKKARKAKRFEEFVDSLALIEKQAVMNRMNDKKERRALAMYYRMTLGPKPLDEDKSMDQAVREKEKKTQAQERIDKDRIEKGKNEVKRSAAKTEFDRQADLATEFKEVENIEMFSLYRELTNFGKILLNNSRAYWGFFMPGSLIKDYRGGKIAVEKTGYHIGLNRILFVGKNSAEKVGRTMAHELGHMFDFLPNNIMNKGNLLGRLYTLSYQFMGSFIDDMRVVDRGRKILNELLPAAYAELKKNPDSVEAQNRIDKLQNEYGAIKQTSKVIIGDIKKELVKVSKIMRPTLWTDNRPSKVEYRYKPSELYADYISALLTAPDMARREAPLFTSRFFDMMDNKPDVRRALIEIQQLLSGTRADILGLRSKHIMEMFGRSEDAVVANLRALRAQDLDIVDQVRSSWMYRWEFSRNLYTDFLRSKRIAKRALIYKYGWAQEMYKTNPEEFDKNPDLNPVFFMGQYDYLGNKVRTNLYQHFQPFYNKMREYELSTQEVSSALFLERISKDKGRDEIANPLGHDKVSAAELLKYLEGKWGKDKADKIFEVANGLREGLLSTFLEYEDLFSVDQIAHIKVMRQSGRGNFYAPFNTAYSMAATLPAGLYHQTGNLNDVNNIVHNILLKNIGVVYAGERNILHSKISKMLGNMFPEDIEKARMAPSPIRITDEDGVTITRIISVPVETHETGRGNLYVLENGKRKLYYVPSQITESITYTGMAYSKQIADVGNAMTQFIKHSYTVFSPGFQLVNFFFRDLQKSLKTFRMVEGAKSGIFGYTWNPAMHLKAFGQLLRYYYRAVPHAYQFEKGDYTDRVMKMLDRGTLIIDYHGRGRILEALDENEMDNIKRSLRKLGVRLDKDAGKKITAKSALKRTVKTLLTPWLALSKLGGIFEAIPKIAGDIYLEEQTFFDSKAKADHWIRNNVGSPNFKKKSALNAEMNGLAIFYNATIRGIESSIDLMTNPKSRSAVWWGMLYFTILPTIYQTMLEAGDDDDNMFGTKRDRLLMRKITEFHKNNTLVFPIMDWAGETLFIKIPMSEENRFIHVIARIATSIIIEDEKRNFAEGTVAVGESILYASDQFPSLNPIFEMAAATSKVVRGKNHADWFTGQDMFKKFEDKDQMYLKMGEKLKMLGKWTLAKAGMRTYLNLLPGTSKWLDMNTYPEKSTWLREIAKNPLFGRILGLTSAGEREFTEKAVKPHRQKESMKAREENRYIDNAVTKYFQQKVTNPEKFFNENVMENLSNRYTMKERNALRDKFQKSLMRTGADDMIAGLSYYNDNTEKAIILLKYKNELPPEDYNYILSEGRRTGALTTETMKKLQQLEMEELNKKARE